jgi:putative flippase GtrA
MFHVRLHSLRRGLNGFGVHRLGRVRQLALVGATATILYAAFAWAGTALLGLASPLASVLAYALAAAPSYWGHRLLTFRSSRPHREAAPRFAGVSALGYGTALVVPLLLTEALGAHPLLAICLVCIAVPVLNAIALSRIVFAAPLLGRQPPQHSGGPS